MNNIIKLPQYFPNGLTIKELKSLVAAWPEIDEEGNPTLVWVETGNGLSSIVTEVWPTDPDISSFSLEFTSNAYKHEAGG